MVSYDWFSNTQETLDLYAKAMTQQQTCHSEAAVVAEFQTFLNAMKQDQSPSHFTSSSLIIHEESGLVLLQFHKKLQAWVQAGGHLEGSETLADACLRETTEETGLLFERDVDWHPLLLTPEHKPLPLHLSLFEVPAFADQPAHRHYDVCFLLKARNCQTVQAPLKWFALRDEMTLTSQVNAGTLTLIEKYKTLETMEKFAFSLSPALDRPKSDLILDSK